MHPYDIQADITVGISGASSERRKMSVRLKCKKGRKGIVVHVFSLDTINKTSNTRQEYCSSFVLSLSNARINHQMSFTQSAHI